MIKRTVEISQQPVFLSVRDEQLLIDARDNGHSTRLGSVPCEDLGVLLVEHPGTIYTHGALAALLRHDAAVVLCGRDHLPIGLLLPIAQHTEVVRRLHVQISVKRPVHKRLWKQLVQAKIRASAANLPPGSTTRSKLLALARQVRSGDPSNLEAQAARVYWSAWRDSLAPGPDSPLTACGSVFHRDPDGPAPNNLLNYGYAVLRAAVARAIVAAGLMPALGIHHMNRSNAFCLADDLVEPLRPLVDLCVRELVHDGQAELTPDVKRKLLALLADDVRVGEITGPLMVALHRMVASLVRAYEGECEMLEIPVMIDSESYSAERPGTQPPGTGGSPG